MKRVVAFCPLLAALVAGGASAAERFAWRGLMAGDFNCVSRTDDFFYQSMESAPYFSTHDLTARETPHVDVLAKRHPGVFRSTAGSCDKVSGARPGYVYVTPALERLVQAIDVSKDVSSRIRREFRLPTQAYRPSDHRPLIVDFNFQAKGEQA